MEQEILPFIIGIPIYPGVDLLDVTEPYEIFNWMGENWKIREVSKGLSGCGDKRGNSHKRWISTRATQNL